MGPLTPDRLLPSLREYATSTEGGARTMTWGFTLGDELKHRNALGGSALDLRAIQAG